MFNRLKAAALFANKVSRTKQEGTLYRCHNLRQDIPQAVPQVKYSEEAEAIIAALESDSSTLDKLLKNIGKDEKGRQSQGNKEAA